MGFAARLLALCALVIFSSGATKADPLAAFLDRMRVASGDPSAAHLRSATEPPPGTDATAVTATESQGLRFFTRRCNGEICTGTWFDGRRLYAVGINGTALPQSRDVERDLRGSRTVASLAFLGAGFARGGGRIRDMGIVAREGRRYRELLVANLDARPLLVDVDPTTALMAASRDDAGGLLATYADYRRSGDYVLPFAVGRDGGTVDRFDSRDVVAGPLAAPAGPSFMLTPARPMRLDTGGTVPAGTCTIAGIAAHCLIDTGNSGLAMSLELSEELGLDPVGAYDVRGLGALTTLVVRTGPLDVANARLGEALYVILPDIHALGFDLIVGADMLAAGTVVLDGPARALSFGGRASPAAAVAPIAFSGLIPIVDARIGEIPATLAIDSGDDANIDLAYDFYTKHADAFVPTVERRVAGVGASGVEMLGEIPVFSIGTTRFGRQSIATTRDLTGTGSGHLGAAFLSRYRVVLDYASRSFSWEEPGRRRYPR